MRGHSVQRPCVYTTQTSTSHIQLNFWVELYIFVFQTHREHHYSGILVDFAIQLMNLLENINRDSFQRFRLRAGLNQV